MALRVGYRPTARLALVAALALGGNATAQERGASPAATGVSVRFEAPPLGRFDAISERPLFSPSRRPPQKVEAKAPEKRTPPPDVVLTGVTMAGARRKAIVLVAGSSRIVAVGERLGDWRIAAIEDQQLTLEFGVQRHLVELLTDPPGGAKPTGREIARDAGRSVDEPAPPAMASSIRRSALPHKSAAQRRRVTEQYDE